MMKLFQKGVAVLLAIIISTQSTALAYAETAEPTTVQTEDGVTFTHNSDGTVTATVYPKLEVRGHVCSSHDKHFGGSRGQLRKYRR